MKYDSKLTQIELMRYTASYELEDDWLEEILEDFESWWY